MFVVTFALLYQGETSAALVFVREKTGRRRPPLISRLFLIFALFRFQASSRRTWIHPDRGYEDRRGLHRVEARRRNSPGITPGGSEGGRRPPREPREETEVEKNMPDFGVLLSAAARESEPAAKKGRSWRSATFTSTRVSAGSREGKPV